MASETKDQTDPTPATKPPSFKAVERPDIQLPADFAKPKVGRLAAFQVDEDGQIEVRWLVKVEDCIPDPANANTHNDRSIRFISHSLKRFGQLKPIVLRPDLVITAGNGMHEAASTVLKWPEIWATQSGLENIEATAYGLADNRTAQLSALDYEVTASLLKEIDASGAAINDLGWEEFELEPLMQAEWEKPQLDDMPGEDDKKSDWHVLHIPAASWKTIGLAINTVRQMQGDDSIGEVVALEAICEAFTKDGQ